MIDTDAAWLAAAIDGEGSIVTQVHQGRFVGARRHFHVSVYNTYLPFVQKAAILLGCKTFSRSVDKLHEDALKQGGPPHATKPAYWATVVARVKVERVLRAVRPFLIIKADKADAALEWLAANPPVDRAVVWQAWRSARSSIPFVASVGGSEEI